MATTGSRKEEILDTAATLFASTGVRTSLQEIADACNILPGSLYSHFESKDAIFVGLVERYQGELDRIADMAVDPSVWGRLPPLEGVIEMSTAIARCSVQHRAALLLTFYEPPSGSSDALVRLARRTPVAVHTALLDLLEQARSAGDLRQKVDVELLADRLYQSMLHVGVGVYHRMRGANRVPATTCWILLHGIAIDPLADAELDRSAATRAADEAIASWDHGVEDAPGTAARVRAAARAEFGRRGYEATTIRDVAAAVGLSSGSIYRSIRSKEDLLKSIIGAYTEKVTDGYNRVLRSPSSPVEKLDALLWFGVNAMERYGEEHRILAAGLREAPPKDAHEISTFASRLSGVKSLVSQGLAQGMFRVDEVEPNIASRCVMDAVWTPLTTVRRAGTRLALEHARETVLRGAAHRHAL